MPLHIDYRPATLEEVVGNDAIRNSLTSILSRDTDRPHAYLFHGPSGCGKTTFGRILGDMLGCPVKDIIEYNSSNTRGIDSIREISDNCRMSSLRGNVKVYLLDEVHKLTNDAQNALLKTLEDTPKHVYFILCTTDPQRLIIALRNRCTQYQVRPLRRSEIRDLLNCVVESEGLSDYPEAVIEKIAIQSEGCPRQALIMLDSVIDIADEALALDAISNFTTNEVTLKEICQLLTAGKSDQKWEQMMKLLKDFHEEPESTRRGILEWLASVLIGSKKNDRVAIMMGFFLDSFMYSGRGGLVQALYFACKE